MCAPRMDDMPARRWARRRASAISRAMVSRSATLPVAKTRTQQIALIALFAGAACIGFSPIFVRLSELGPIVTGFYRVGLAVPFLVVWLAFEQRGKPAATASIWRSPWGLVLSGLTFAADIGFWHLSITLTSVANATLLANFTPIFVTLGAYFIFGERFRPSFFVGLALALSGAALLMGESLSIGSSNIWGDLVGIVTAFFYGSYLLVVSRLRSTYSTATIMVWSAVITALILLPIAALAGEALVPMTFYGWAIMFGVAWVSHIAGSSLIAYSLAHLPVAFSSIGLLLQPVVAAVMAWILLAEPLGLLQGLGGMVVLAGVIIARLASRPA